jgi:hypothetical protein
VDLYNYICYFGIRQQNQCIDVLYIKSSQHVLAFRPSSGTVYVPLIYPLLPYIGQCLHVRAFYAIGHLYISAMAMHSS